MKKRKKCLSYRNKAEKAKVFITTFIITLLITCPVYASSAEPTLVSGTRKLIAAMCAIITGMVAGLLTFQAGKCGMLWLNASPEEKPKYQKDLVHTILAGIVTLTIGSTITYIIGFYAG